MATRGVAVTIQYVAWDTINNAGKTGDASNHTLRWIKDGAASAPTNSPSEVDATNCPGVYKLQLTSSETDCNIGTLAGKSSSSGVVILPVTIQFERPPDDVLATVWDVDLSEHTANGSTGKALKDAADAAQRIYGTTIVFAPVNPVSKQITLIKGDSYLDSDGRSLKFVFGPSPNLQGRTLRFIATDSSGSNQLLTITPTLSVQEGKQILTVELTSSDTSLLPIGHNAVSYELEAVYNSQKITLVMGRITVLSDYA